MSDMIGLNVPCQHSSVTSGQVLHPLSLAQCQLTYTANFAVRVSSVHFIWKVRNLSFDIP